MENQQNYGSAPIGRSIRKIRELKNFTQEQVAEQLGMTPSGYSRIERAEVGVSLEKLQRIADILGVKMSDITSFDDSVFFNNYGHAEGQSFSFHRDDTAWEKLEEQFRERILAMQAEIDYLRKQNEILLKNLK